jgi:hypothetical protein
LFGVKKDLYKDIKAAEILGTPDSIINKASERISKKEFNNINTGIFKPLDISDDIKKAFRENFDKLGLPNPFDQAADVITNIKNNLLLVPLTEETIPKLENPFKNLAEPTLGPVSGLPQLPNPTKIPGYGQINLPTAVAGNQVNPLTKLTQVEEALLSPTEKIIRQKQRTT